MPIYKPPQRLPETNELNGPTIFLAGSIEQGTATEWQERLTFKLIGYNAEVVILNPRRDHWDDTVAQDINNPIFRSQVDWELDAIAMSDLVIMYFDKRTKSPVTLLEFGLVAAEWPEHLVVCCPEGFWRKGNVDIVCDRLNIAQVDDASRSVNEHLDTLADYAAEYFGWVDDVVEEDFDACPTCGATDWTQPRVGCKPSVNAWASIVTPDNWHRRQMGKDLSSPITDTDPVNKVFHHGHELDLDVCGNRMFCSACGAEPKPEELAALGIS